MEQKHYFESLMSNMETRWEQQCMTNLGEGDSYTYKSLATTIARLHAQFKVLGIEEGDRIALAGRNCTNWGVAFLAITSYKAVVVSILPDFTGDDIEKLVTHSGAKLLFVGPNVKNKIHPEQIDRLLGTVFMDEWNMYNAKEEKTIESYTKAGTDFDKQYPDGITFAQVNYPTDNLNDLAIINYTSGSTGTPKGVMLTNLSLSANVNFAIRMIPHKPGDTVLSMLPIAHMFGLMFEFLYQICDGTPIFFLTTAPTPSTLMKALAEVKPFMILTVPLVIEKIIRKSVFPVIQKPYMRILWHTPIVKNILRKKVKERLMTAFGNRLRHLILGGAALNEEVEICLKEMKMPYCVGYGMTECGPLLAYADWRIYQPRSCGKAIDCMQFRIMSSSPENKEGELQVKGDCIMTGYYHNEQATKEAFTEDGWMRTGDLGIIDKDGNLFLRGRSKNMILSASGQNIYPEEIEDKVNSLNEVTESVVVDRDGKIIALIYPQDTLRETLSKEDLQNTLTEAIHKVNEKLPKYSQISAIEVRTEPFLKTPKQSIKRYLYK